MTISYPKKIRALSHFTLMDAGVSGYAVGPGDVIDIRPNVFENTRDINGDSWLTLTEEEQISKYGEQRFAVEETS